MKRFGRVISVSEEEAKVLVQKHSACKNCGECHDTSQEVRIANSAELDRGDIIALELEGRSLSTAAVMIYLLPLIGLIGGYLLGVYLGFKQEWTRILLGGGLFSFSFWLARQLGKADLESYDVQVTEIITKG